MNIKIRLNLLINQIKLSPSRRFRNELHAKLNEAWLVQYHTDLKWFQTVTFKWSVASAVIVLAAGSFGTGVYAYSSPEVTSDSLLYPLKQKMEQVEELAARTAEQKAKLYLKKIQRREAELVVETVRGKRADKIEEQITKIEDKIEKIDKTLEAEKFKDKTLRPRLEETLKNRKQKLEHRAEKRSQKKYEVERRVEKVEAIKDENRINM